jgi:acid phosphatase family membrane protein YuiD
MAQAIKVLTGFIKYWGEDRSRVIWRIIWAGGMPSVHSSVITSVAVTI